MNSTDIGWTDYTWNPTHGCSKISAGCKNCYAETISHRFSYTTKPWSRGNAEQNVKLQPHKLEDPVGIDPGWVFVNSMSDLFHPEIPDSYIEKVIDVIRKTPHIYQVLTKHDVLRADRFDWPENAMVGVSVENRNNTSRIDRLKQVDCNIRFISFEPLLEDLGDYYFLDRIDWAIIGGESGLNHREMDPEWARKLIGSCRVHNIPVFFKQHSARYPESNIKIKLRGKKRVVREFPDVPSSYPGSPKQKEVV